MKRCLFVIFAVIAFVSCSSYTQITTLSSDNVSINSNGDYACDAGDILIQYDFWSSCGKVDFWVENTSDKDIILDLSRSYFIKNGVAYDYFLARKISSAFGTTSRSVRSYSNYYQRYKAVHSTSTSFEYADITSKGIEFKERPMITIPAKSKKKFSEYNVTDGEYQECGFARNPKNKERIVKKYTVDNSPIVIENRLLFTLEGKETPVINLFYVSALENMNKREAFHEERVTDCCGNETQESIYVSPYASKDRYYVNYKCQYGDNDNRAQANNTTETSQRKYLFSR